ncbi:hypothetical protein CSC28_1990 [Pseudomonas paraeruginosa]|nr:hypothetical protein CSC28_1990 [Pseudomonas paraeruginosa]
MGIGRQNGLKVGGALYLIREDGTERAAHTETLQGVDDSPASTQAGNPSTRLVVRNGSLRHAHLFRQRALGDFC